jgi:hypothetical protein
MATETHTGRLIVGDGEIDMEDGTVLAVLGSPTPRASALARYEKWGQTQPVTVTGTTGTSDGGPVLFVTSIQWAAQASAPASADDFSTGSVMSLADNTAAAPAIIKNLAPQKKAAPKSTRSRSKK